jgi:L-aminopeptidase/D-esterase-like protein
MKARELGIPFDGTPGKLNAITDVEGVLVGHKTVIKGEGKLVVGKGPVRTGVTTIFPVGKTSDEIFAGFFSYNGNGEMTGSHWLEETGHLKGPIAITNTHSVGTVRDAIIEWLISNNLLKGEYSWSLPVVTETYDGWLNDINGFHVKKEDVFEALDNTKSGDVQEGSVGGGTGMICHQFKGGIGTSSRVIKDKFGGYTIGALVQANYGLRTELTIAGVPVGNEISNELLPVSGKTNDKVQRTNDGSIIVIIATDAPLLPYQLKRIAKRVAAGLGRVGGYGDNNSGDIFLAFSTANILDSREKQTIVKEYDSLNDNMISPMFKATAEVVEEAIINALVNGETMKGINDNTVHALPHDKLIEIMKKYNRLNKEA